MRIRTAHVRAALVVAAVTAVGAIGIGLSRAATYASSQEAETGLLAGNANTAGDAAASAGSMVRFGSGAGGIVQPVGIPGSWNLKFDDEFSGTKLDLTKWTPNWLGGPTDITPAINSAGTNCYDPANVIEASGELDYKVTAAKCTDTVTGKTWDYTSGMAETDGHFNFTYGVAEARIWTPAGKGMWPAFWTDGQTWPNDGEIDVLEAYGDDISTQHYHYAGCAPDESCGPGSEITTPGATAGWHVYSADWEPGKVTWYIDGQPVWQLAQGIQSKPNYLILNLEVNVASGAAAPNTMRTDYVRVWQHP